MRAFDIACEIQQMICFLNVYREDCITVIVGYRMILSILDVC